MPIGGHIDCHDFVPVGRLDVIERGTRTGNRGVTDEDIEPLVALIERRGEPVEAGIIAHVERHQRGRTAGFARRVVKLFERTDRTRHRDHMRTGTRQRQRRRTANAA